MIGHRPDICYPAAGWMLMNEYYIDLPLSGGNKLPCTILQFERNELYKEKVIILNYFIADGEHYGEASATRSRAGYRLADVRYITQVQISATVRSNVSLESTLKIVSDFAIDSAFAIANLSDDIQGVQNSDESRSNPEGK
jgi:hypothetical protein